MIGSQITAHKQRRKIRLIVICCLGISVIMNSTASSDVKRRQLSVPIQMGDRLVRSGLVIACDVEDYDMSFSTFRKSAANPDEMRFADFISAVSANNIDKARAVSKSVTATGDENIKIERALSMLKAHIVQIGIRPDLSNFKICHRIYWGDRDFFTYKVADPNSSYWGLLGFERDPDKGLLWNPYLSDFESELWKMAPTDYDNEQSVSHDYRFTITPDHCFKHPVDLLFNGRVNGITQTEDDPQASDVALLFYEAFKMDLENTKNIQGFRKIGNKYYDAHSRKKFLRWIDSDYQAFLQWKNDLVSREREVVFVMDADPVFVIFYHLKGMSDWYIQQDYIVRDGDRLYITRLAFDDDLSRSFRNRKKFIEPFLMVLVKNYQSSSQ